MLVSLLFVAEAWAIKCPKGTTPEREVDGNSSEVFCLDAEGEKHGPFVDTGPESTGTGTYRNGEPHGRWTITHKDHVEIRDYKMGVQHGKDQVRFSDGRYFYKGSYHEGEKHGLWQVWDASTGKKKHSVGRFRHGIPVGKWKWYTLEGALHHSFDMGNGDGLWTEYEHWMDGFEKREQGLYRNGKKHSTWSTYRRGKIVCSTPYFDGKIHGTKECNRRDGANIQTPYLFGRENGIGERRDGGKVAFVCYAGGSSYWTETVEAADKGAIETLRKKACSCRLSRFCESLGHCGFRNGECQSTSDADCQQSRACKQQGECAARDGRCVYSEAGCAQSGICKRIGYCALNASADHCHAVTEAHCQQANTCKAKKRCVPWAGRCVRAGRTNSECRQPAADGSLPCQEKGECTARGGACIIGSDADCQQTEGCKIEGECTLKGGFCWIGSDADCQQSANCKNKGGCAAVNGLCRAEQDAHCQQSTICNDQGKCTRGEYGSCEI